MLLCPQMGAVLRGSCVFYRSKFHPGAFFSGSPAFRSSQTAGAHGVPVYHRELSFTTEELSQKEETMRCILHFDAVDQEATVVPPAQSGLALTAGRPSIFPYVHHRICKRRSGISLCKSPGSDRHRLRHQRQADPEPRRHVLHRPERHLAECLVRMGSGKLCDQL